MRSYITGEVKVVGCVQAETEIFREAWECRKNRAGVNFWG